MAIVIRDALKKLESDVLNYGLKSDFSKPEIENLPKIIQIIFEYKIFGTDILAIPNLCEDEPEIPICFVSSKSEIDFFEQEYREFFPKVFSIIGFMHGADQLILFNNKNSTVHECHVDDVFDESLLDYKLETVIASFSEFVTSIIPQTITCFMNPNHAGQYDIIEIKKPSTVQFGFNYGQTNAEYGEKEFSTLENAWEYYIDLIKKSAKKGFTIHYGPKKLQNYLAENTLDSTPDLESKEPTNRDIKAQSPNIIKRLINHLKKN